MKLRATALAVLVIGIGGCGLLSRIPRPFKPPPPSPPTFSQYHLDNWNWDDVNRVLVLPFLNESPYTTAGEEIRAAFTSELQKLGRFEVVAGPPDDQAVLAAKIHRSGRFDEVTMLEIGRVTRADVIVQGIVTQYSPYPRPRLGLIIQAVGPREMKIVASVDGLWDTTDRAIAERLRTYYRQRPVERPAFIRNTFIVSDDAFAGELALDSPALFQRWVCSEAALSLVGLPVPGVVIGGGMMGGLPSAVNPPLGCLPPSGPQQPMPQNKTTGDQ
jgi:hypothetical protein